MWTYVKILEKFFEVASVQNQERKFKRPMSFLVVIAAALLTFDLFAARNTLAADLSPTEQLKESLDKLQSTLHDKNLDETAKKKILREIIIQRFDFSEISKRVLGRYWKSNEARLEEFTPLLVELLERAYSKKINIARDAKVIYLSEKTDGQFAVVNTKIITPRGEQFSVSYRLDFVGEEWKVYDIIAENVSLVSNYRAQFNAILANHSFDYLLDKIREKLRGN